MKLKEEEEAHENHERWLVTYSDMITLLMVFFIVMYSMSSINAQKFAKVAQGLNDALGGGKKNVLLEGDGDKLDFLSDNSKVSSALNNKSPNTPNSTGQNGAQSSQAEIKEALKQESLNKAKDEMNLHTIESNIVEYIKEQNLTNEVTVYSDARGTVISFKEALLFQKASATIYSKGTEVLDKIAVIVSKVENYIRVEGSTDDLPIHNAEFASNWELGSKRAINVANELINKGVNPGRVSCLSYGEYRPTVPNVNEANRSKNRKVDIILIYRALDKLEP